VAGAVNVSDRPTAVQQGLVVAEADEDGWLVMFPDGEVRHFNHVGKVEDAAKAYFKRTLGDIRAIGVGRIEWRGLR
jgi:hypothetical protein